MPWRGQIFVLLVGLMVATAAVAAEDKGPAVLTVSVPDGRILADHGGGAPHHPASLTKLMTAYVALRAVQAGRTGLDATVTVSERAAAQGGSLLGLRRGDTLSLGAALRGMIVRSGNDAAVTVAEHISGSEAAFAEAMTAEARRLGMTATSFRNATGLTAPGHVTTPRDMAILALAIQRDFPASMVLFSARDTVWRGRTLPTVNGFLGNFSGAEGMKTGFTCPAGYNLVALAHRGAHRAVTVVMGASSSAQRLATVSRAMNSALSGGGGPGMALSDLPNLSLAPPDLSPESCGGRAGVAVAGPMVKAPSGWGLEVAFGPDREKVRRQTAAALGRLRPHLGGGSAQVVLKPRDGMLRYRGLILGLGERRAVDTCLSERARGGEERCTVLTPLMVGGAFDEERRFRMISAR